MSANKVPPSSNTKSSHSNQAEEPENKEDRAAGKYLGASLRDKNKTEKNTSGGEIKKTGAQTCQGASVEVEELSKSAEEEFLGGLEIDGVPRKEGLVSPGDLGGHEINPVSRSATSISLPATEERSGNLSGLMFINNLPPDDENENPPFAPAPIGAAILNSNNASFNLVEAGFEIADPRYMFYRRSNGALNIHADPNFNPPPNGAVLYYGQPLLSLDEYGLPVNNEPAVIDFNDAENPIVANQWLVYRRDGTSYEQREFVQQRADGSTATLYHISDRFSNESSNEPNNQARVVYQEVRDASGDLSQRSMEMRDIVTGQILAEGAMEDGNFVVRRPAGAGNGDVSIFDNNNSLLASGSETFRIVGGIRERVSSIMYGESGYYAVERQFNDNQVTCINFYESEDFRDRRTIFRQGGSWLEEIYDDDVLRVRHEYISDNYDESPRVDVSLTRYDASSNVISRTTYDVNGVVDYAVELMDPFSTPSGGEEQVALDVPPRRYIETEYDRGLPFMRNIFVADDIDSEHRARIQTTNFEFDHNGDLTRTTAQDMLGGITTTTYERQESDDGSVALTEESVTLSDADSENSSVTLCQRTTTTHPNGDVESVVDQVTGGSEEQVRAELDMGGNALNRVHAEISTSEETGADGIVIETQTSETISVVGGVSSSSSSVMQVRDPDGVAVVERLETTHTSPSNITVTRTTENHETVVRVENQGEPVETLTADQRAAVDQAELAELSALAQHAEQQGEASIAGMLPSGTTLEELAQGAIGRMAESANHSLSAFTFLLSIYQLHQAVKNGDKAGEAQGVIGVAGGASNAVSVLAPEAADLVPSATESLLLFGEYAGKASGILNIASVGWLGYDLGESIHDGDTHEIVEDSVNLAGALSSMAAGGLIGGPAGALTGFAIGLGTVGFDLLWDKYHPDNATHLGGDTPGIQPNLPALSPEVFSTLPPPSQEARLWSAGILKDVGGLGSSENSLLHGGATVAQLADIADGASDDQVRTQLKASHPDWAPEAIELHLSQLKKASAYLAAYPSEFRALETFGAATVLATAASEEDGKLTSLADFHEVYKTEIQQIMTEYPDGLPSFNESAEENQALGEQNPALWRLGNFGQPNSHQPLAYEEVVLQNFDEIDGFGRRFQGERQNDGVLGWEEMVDAREQALQNKQYDLYFSLDYVMRHGATLFPNAGEGETLKLSSDQLTQRATTDQNQRTAAVTLLDAGFSKENAVKYAPSMTPKEFESGDFKNSLIKSIVNGALDPLALLQARYPSDVRSQASQREKDDEGFLVQWALEPRSLDSLQKIRSLSILDMINTRGDLSEYGIDYCADFDKIYNEYLTGSQADKLFALGPDRISYIQGKMEATGSMQTLSLKEISNLSAGAADELMSKLKRASSEQAVNSIVYQNKITDPASAFYTLAVNQLKTAAGQVSSDNAGLPPEAMKTLVGNLTLFEVLHTKSDEFTSTLAQYKAQPEADESEPDRELSEEASTYTDTLKSGEELHQNEPLKSADGRYELLLQDDGNLVIYGTTDRDRNNKRVIWDSGTVGSEATTLAMQGDGNLVLYDADFNKVWATNTNQGKATHIRLNNEGSLELYEGTTACLWKTEKDPFPNAVYVFTGGLPTGVRHEAL